MPVVTRKQEAKQYDGTNGQEIVNWLRIMELFTDDGKTLTFGNEYEYYEILVGWWIVRDTGSRSFLTYCTPEEFAVGWEVLDASA
ncbi:hypothetical protein ACFCX0_03415 [Streptomyces sp. NPDC056352]|uniref:hypothetical protein n=1 Tax=Streptomyces sp. NPDC056352 TaxID=3345791 RepID=UPI0035DD505C